MFRNIDPKQTGHIWLSSHPTHSAPSIPHPAYAPHRWNTHMLLRHLRPARPSASSPAPTRGRGQSWRYPAGSRARFFPGISPCSGPWWLSPLGEGLTVRGESSPLPCLQPPNSVILVVPVSPAPSALLPRPPPGGEGSAGRYSVGSRARFFSGISPGRWTVGISPWGGGDGRCGTGSLQARRPGGADGCLRPGTGIPGRPQFQDHPGETDRNNRQNE